MRSLNRRYRGRDYATDVLSFPYSGESQNGKPFLGEITISPEVAWDQARCWNTTPQREVRRLLIHGILHLLGYDHEMDAGEMAQLEKKLVRRLIKFEAGPLLELRQ
jgi:probable rRNA maturation factor